MWTRNNDLRHTGRASLDVKDSVGTGRSRAHDRCRGNRTRTGRDADPRCTAALDRDTGAVERHVQILRARSGGRRPTQARAARLRDLQVVLRIQRERVPNDDATPRAERQPLDMNIL